MLLIHFIQLRFDRQFLPQLYRWISNQFAKYVQKGLCALIVRRRWDIIILQILFTMKHYVFRLHLPINHISFISHQHNGNTIAHSHQIFIPIWNLSIGCPRREVEHYDGCVGTQIEPISQPPTACVAYCIPNAKIDWALIGLEGY